MADDLHHTPEPEEHHRALARTRGWPDSVLASILQLSAHIRALTDSPGPRRCFTLDRELVEAGERADCWECVDGEGELVVIRQLSPQPDGTVRRYGWERLEDDAGFLTDQPIDPMTDPVTEIDPQEFRERWDGAGS